MKTTWNQPGRLGLIFGLLACGSACGGEDDSQVERAVEAAELAAEAAQTAAAAAQLAAQAAQTAATRAPAAAPVVTTPVAVTPPVGSGVVPPPTGSSTGCVAPPGVSAAPETLPQVIALINSLPKPATLPCFVQSLARPLSLYLTSSKGSLQPAPDAKSPRTFILRGSLELSIVLAGEASDTLEMAYRTTEGRSIKSEILFPIYNDVTAANLFDRIELGQGTQCGFCHAGELEMEFEGFPNGVWESDQLDPYSPYDVSIESLYQESLVCNAGNEPARCALLDALFDGGPVEPGELGDPTL